MRLKNTKTCAQTRSSAQGAATGAGGFAYRRPFAIRAPAGTATLRIEPALW
jgi:hypothetical protein